MKKHFLLLVIPLLCWGIFSSSTAQIHISGPQSGILQDTLYIVDQEISVDLGDSLVIEPGAIFLFNDSSGFRIQGYLYAVGQEQDSIIFAPNQGATGWDGIDFGAAASDSSKLGYCLITGSTDIGIFLNGCNMTIAHCTICNNSGGDGWGGGVRCTVSSPIITNCVITDNEAGLGGGICCFAGGKAFIKDCLIANNHGHEAGGIHVELNSSATLNGCVLTGNSSEQRGGGVCVLVNSRLTITNCTIYNNSCQEPYGGGIYAAASTKFKMLNSIVAGNSNGGVWGERMYCLESIRYCDFYGNDNGDFIGTPLHRIGTIFTTNLNGDSCDDHYNIFHNPLFVNSGAGDFHLESGSPCIDAGNPRGPHDPDSTIADIGAFYFDQGIFTLFNANSPQPSRFETIMNYPNPFNLSTQINYSLANTGYVELSICNILGQRIATLVQGMQSSGTHTLIWNAKDASSGIYFARLQNGEQIKTIKMVLLK
jgi:hypothetical protein